MIVKQKGFGAYFNKACATGDITTIVQAYVEIENELDTHEFTITIDETIASLYKDYGYIVETEGIGWKIKRS